MTQLRFAQISDIHISARGNIADMLSGRAAGFFQSTVDGLNQQPDLDFVLFTGDFMVDASAEELMQVQQILQTLQKPYYIVPGNHDRREPDSLAGLTRHDFARLFNPQYTDRPATPELQAGYWSVSLGADVQLIGLDSIRDADWGGVIDPPQLAWLEQELTTHADKLVIVAVHHPLHKLAPIDDHPAWNKFVCSNGPEVLALLDRHPPVKLVLTGHHHVTQANRLGSRLHLACPAMCIYPCAYRTLQISQQADRRWQITWQTHPATDEATVAEAYGLVMDNWINHAELEPIFVEEYAQIALGNPFDRAGQFLA